MRGAMTRVAVLGAGLQGASVALELAANGVEVDLYDQAGHCLAGASSNNEGKIHFGYVYANDPSLRTARTLIEGALAFSPLLRRWLGPAAANLLTAAFAATVPNVWRVTTRPKLIDDPFQLGVASGDPTSTGGVIWTRLAPRPLEPEGGMDGQRTVVQWEVADDDGRTSRSQVGARRAPAGVGCQPGQVGAGSRPVDDRQRSL